MAVNNQTVGALASLNQILSQQFAAREADKDRGVRILQMKIQSDEREADRVNQQIISLQAQNAAYERELMKLAGTQAAMDAVGSKGTGEGAAIVGRERQALAMDIDGMREQMSSLQARKQSLLDELGTYYNAYETLAPESFERFVATGSDKTLSGISTIGDDEWGQIQAEYEKTTGKKLSKSQSAGLRRRFDELGKTRFDQEYKERLLGLQEFENRLRLQKSKAGSGKEISEYFDDLFQRKIDQYNQYVNALQMRNREHNVIGASFIPNNIPRSVEDIQAAFQENAQNLADWALKYRGLDMAPTLKKTLDLYKEAKSSGHPEEREQLSYAIYEILQKNPENIAKGDYSSIPLRGAPDSPERYFGHDLIKALNTLQGALAIRTQQLVAENPDAAPALYRETDRLINTQRAYDTVDEIIKNQEQQETTRDYESLNHSINVYNKLRSYTTPPSL